MPLFILVYFYTFSPFQHLTICLQTNSSAHQCISLSLNPYRWHSSLCSWLVHANRTRTKSRTGTWKLAWREVLVLQLCGIRLTHPCCSHTHLEARQQGSEIWINKELFPPAVIWSCLQLHGSQIICYESVKLHTLNVFFLSLCLFCFQYVLTLKANLTEVVKAAIPTWFIGALRGRGGVDL